MFERFSNLYKTVRLAFQTGYTEPQMSQISNNSKKSLLNRLQYSYQWRIKAEVDLWRSAIEAAESPIRPDRRALYSIYREVELNSEVTTQTRVANYTVARSPFVIEQNGNENEQLKELFERSWFNDFLELCVQTEFYGHTLIEFDPFKINNEFRHIYCVPRDHVRPEYGDVILNQSDFQGVDFRDKKQFPFLVELGRPWDFGLFRVVSLPAIRMKYSDSDWSLFSEKFGMPIMAVKTATRDKNELDEKERMAANLGANGYVILDDMDSIEFMSGSQGTSPHGVFLERINKAENQIAKLINGQSSSSDEKAHVGSAEVHERILNNFTFARLRKAQFIINETLIPFLIENGYPLSDCKFKFTELFVTTKNDQEELNGSDKPAPSPKTNEKKKTNPNVKNTFGSFDTITQHYKQDDCCGIVSSPFGKVKMGLDLTALINQVASDIYTERTKAGDLNIDLWKKNVDALVKGMEKGYGKSYIDTAYSDPDKQVLAQLRQNAMVFAAFKNHANIAQMVGLLKDSKGNIRPFGEFKRMVMQVNKKYNVNWLNAEYDTAMGAARMAANWHHTIEEYGDDVLLRYSTVGDSRVREAHKILDAVTLPANNDFWKTYYPPNGWRCRCDVDVVFDEPTKEPDALPDDKSVPPTFRFNPGATNQLFSAQHPYLLLIEDKEQRENIIKQMNKFKFDGFEQDENYLTTASEANEKEFKHLKKYPNALGYNEENGGYLVLHKLHEKDALKDELEVMAFLKDQGHRCELLPEHKKNGNEADAFVNEMIFDIKKMANASDIGRRVEKEFKDAKKKTERIIYHIAQDVDFDVLKKAFKKGAYNVPQITECWVVYKNELYCLSRNKMLQQSWIKKAK